MDFVGAFLLVPQIVDRDRRNLSTVRRTCVDKPHQLRNSTQVEGYLLPRFKILNSNVYPLCDKLA